MSEATHNGGSRSLTSAEQGSLFFSSATSLSSPGWLPEGTRANHFPTRPSDLFLEKAKPEISAVQQAF